MGRDAAALACVCKAAAAAAQASKWRFAARIGRSGAVLEPASGAFDVTVAPGEGVQAAVERCPPGGSVLLLPGTHAGPLVLAADREANVFGRGRAVLIAAGDVVTSRAKKSTLDGLTIRREASSVISHGVDVKGGALRLQACDVTSATGTCLRIEGGADPVLTVCRCVRERARQSAVVYARPGGRGGTRPPLFVAPPNAAPCPLPRQPLVPKELPLLPSFYRPTLPHIALALSS